MMLSHAFSSKNFLSAVFIVLTIFLFYLSSNTASAEILGTDQVSGGCSSCIKTKCGANLKDCDTSSCLEGLTGNAAGENNGIYCTSSELDKLKEANITKTDCGACMTEAWDTYIKQGYSPESLVTSNEHLLLDYCTTSIVGDSACSGEEARQWISQNKNVPIKCQAEDDNICKNILSSCPLGKEADKCYAEKVANGNVQGPCCSQKLLDAWTASNGGTPQSNNSSGSISGINYPGFGIFDISSCKTLSGAAANINDPGKNELLCIGQKTISMLLAITGAIVVVMIIISGIGYMTSMGNPAQTAWAKKSLVGAIIGLIIVVMAYSIVKLLTILLT